MYLRRKQYDRALSDFERCLAINPCNRAANVNSSQILFHIKKEPHRAVERLEKLLKYDPRYATARKYHTRFAEALPDRPETGKVAEATPEKSDSDDRTSLSELPEWIKNLPDVPEVKPVPVTPGIDYSSLTDAQYAGAVRAAREASRQLLGPMSKKEEKLFNEKWQPMLDYPAPQCITYLEKFVPVVEKTLGTRAALAEHLLIYDRLWNEAGYVTYYNEDAGARIMESVAHEAAAIESLKKTLQKLMSELAALGDPPDASKLKAQQANRHRRAMRALERLLGKSAPLEGVYDRVSLVTYQYEGNNRDKPFYSQTPLQKRGGRRVFIPISKNRDGQVLFFDSRLREPVKPGHFLDPNMAPEAFVVMYAEPQDGSWVSY
jgi:hypothetical protein